jgi:hypothetical protein
MCVQLKKPEVSVMYLKGDISILVPAVFRTIVAILTAPAVNGIKLLYLRPEMILTFSSFFDWLFDFAHLPQ